MNSAFVKTTATPVTMSTDWSGDAHRQQARRRLRELELAARLGDGLELAWHIAQAVRSGASPAEVAEAVNARDENAWHGESHRDTLSQRTDEAVSWNQMVRMASLRSGFDTRDSGGWQAGRFQ